MMCSFFTAGICFSGTLCQMFFVCELTFCELTKERVRNNPIVALKSYSSCHKQSLGVPFRRSVLKDLIYRVLGEKNLLLLPVFFPVEAFPGQNEKWKRCKICFRILGNMKRKLIPTFNDKSPLFLSSAPPPLFIFHKGKSPGRFFFQLCFVSSGG